MLLMVPELGFGVVALSNLEDSNAQLLAEELERLLLNAE
jgi:hypothetical protein